MAELKRLMLAGAVVAAIGISAVALAQHGTLPKPEVQFAEQHAPIPFELFRGNRIFVPIVINGHKVNAMLDTGASVTVLDEEFARSIGLKATSSIAGHGTGGIVKSGLASGVSLDVGGLQLREMTVAMLDLKPVARGIGHPIDVILGQEFFNSAVVSIDWAANTLQIKAPNAFRAPDGATEVKLGRLGRFNTIPVTIGESDSVTALLDVGNGANLSLPRSFWSAKPSLSELRYAQGVAGGVGGLHDIRQVTLPAATLAGQRFSNIPTSFGTSEDSSDPTRMANVGIGLLRNFQIDLDLGHDRVYFRPRRDAPPFERDRSGLRMDLLSDRLKVVFVSPQGPSGGAGIKAGDEIVAVNGVRVGPGYYSRPDWTRGPAGTQASVDLADGRNVSVTLRDYY